MFSIIFSISLLALLEHCCSFKGYKLFRRIHVDWVASSSLFLCYTLHSTWKVQYVFFFLISPLVAWPADDPRTRVWCRSSLLEMQGQVWRLWVAFLEVCTPFFLPEMLMPNMVCCPFIFTSCLFSFKAWPISRIVATLKTAPWHCDEIWQPA